jgi:outer membrane protein assembly factor BamB
MTDRSLSGFLALRNGTARWTTAAIAAAAVLALSAPARGQNEAPAPPGPIRRVPVRPGVRPAQAAQQMVQPRQILQRRVRGRLGPDGQLAVAESEANYAIFPNNRELVRQLDLAKQLIKEQRLSDAFELIDDILGESQDFFFQAEGDDDVHRSLKSEARRLVTGLPREALAQYELQFGAAARQLLDKAAASGGTAEVMEVVRRYFNTQAGYEAAWLLGRQHLDHGQSLAAALVFQMLYDTPVARRQFDPALSLVLATSWVRGGAADRARDVLGNLRATGAPVRLGGKDVPLFKRDDGAVEWLLANTGIATETIGGGVSQWALHRGNPARNALGSGGSPLLSTPRWQQSLSSDPPEPQSSEAMSRQLVGSDEVDLPAESPLAVGDTAVVRTPKWVVGVNMRTGKRIWEYPTWESENYVASQQVVNPATGGRTSISLEKLATRTTISSDGEAVFIIEDRGNQPFLTPGMINPFGRGVPGVIATTYNKLLARDLATEGKLLWEVGGETGEAEPQLAGVYFLGAPLAIGGQLYVIGELKGEISLFVLDAQSGALSWSQPLATVEITLAMDSFRRLHGAMPSFADGVLVCPTSAGAVVAVDLAHRSLLWGYQYPRNQGISPFRVRRSGEIPNPFSRDRWTDGSVIVASGKVLIAPPDSDYLHCVNLVDGKEMWKAARGDNLFVGCVDRETVLLVGPRELQGLKLSDGHPAWPDRSFAGDGAGVPSGRGFASAGHYFLPLSSAEVLKIDLANGTIDARVKSRKGFVPGNLVAYDGQVLSLNGESLDCFFQLDEQEQWAADRFEIRPDDPEALAMFGEILVDQGRYGEGLTRLERAFALAPNERVRELLVEAHLELLRHDFAAHRERAADIEKLLTSPSQKAAFAREMAIGLEKQGDVVDAFDYFVKMCQPQEQPLELEVVAPNQLLVRRDRWVQGKLAALLRRSSPDDRQKMTERMERQLAEMGGAADLDALRQFVDYFGAIGSFSHYRDELVERLIGKEQMLEAEWRLMRRARSTNSVEAASAYLRLAELMTRLNRPDDAANSYRTLVRRFGNLPVAGRQTPQQVIDALSGDSAVRHYLTYDEQWPKVVIEATDAPRGLDYIAAQVEVSAGREPFFSNLTLELDLRRKRLYVRDGYGRERFDVDLNDSKRGRRIATAGGVPWACANGHILLIQQGTQISAIDALSADQDGKSRLLWEHDLADLINVPGPIRAVQSPSRRGRHQWVDQTNRPVGGIWPVGREMVCLQRGSTLVAIDAFSGEALWTRYDVAPAGDVFGDESFVFIAPAGGGDAVVLQALDGATLGKRKMLPLDRYWTSGRMIVETTSAADSTAVRVRDLSVEENDGEVWQGKFAAAAKVEAIGDEEFAVLDAAGKLIVYSLDAGKPLIETMLAPVAPLTDLQVFRTADRYVVLAARPVQQQDGTIHRYQVQNTAQRNQPIVEGATYAFDRRSGKLLWEKTLPPTSSLINQPAHLPILVFAMNQNDQSRPGPQRSSTRLLLLDTRSGATYETSLKQSTSSAVVVADPEQQTLEIRCSTATKVLKFGEK